MNTLLNISIPTYNRPDFLRKCLMSILTSVRNLNIEDRVLVSVYVTDNSSSDSSMHIVENPIFKELNLYYKRNFENIGSDRNIALCYLYEDAKFVMILGDDDFLSKNSLRNLIPLLKRGEYSIYFLRAYGLTSNEKESRDDRVRGMRVFNSIGEIVLERNIDLAFISNMIFRRCDYTEVEVGKGIGTSLVQLSLVLNIARKCQGKSLYVDADFIMATRNNTDSYNPVDIFVTNYFNVLLENVNGDLNSVLPALRTRMMHSFYNRSIAQYMRKNMTPLPEESLLILDSLYNSMILYRIFYRPLFQMSNFSSFSLLSFAYILGSVFYSRGSKIRDFRYHLFQWTKQFFER